jgi:hypothetical protein
MRSDSRRILAETYNPFVNADRKRALAIIRQTDAIANSNTGNFDSVHFNIESS